VPIPMLWTGAALTCEQGGCGALYSVCVLAALFVTYVFGLLEAKGGRLPNLPPCLWWWAVVGAAAWLVLTACSLDSGDQAGRREDG
jgi:hypothetical protein